MATIDVGKLTFTHKGDYSSSTAYVANDVVYYSTNGNAYIAKTSTTGNAPTSTAHWNLFVLKGTDGVDADLGQITGTVQGDIYYNNGSAIARLAPGTSGQVLQTGGASANPSWGTVSSDFVKIHNSSTSSGSSATINLQNVFDDTVYNHYMLMFNYRIASNNGIKARFLNGSTAYSGGTDYRRSAMHMYRRNDNSEGTISQNNDGNGVDHMSMMGWGHNTSYNNYAFMNIGGELNTANGDFPRKYCLIDAMGVDNSGGSAGVYWWGDQYWHHFSNNGAVDGIQITANDTITKYSLTLWGLKK